MKILYPIGFLICLFLGNHCFSQSSKQDKFGGVGISIGIDSSVELPYIVEILSGKPGAMAGLRSGDHIISINKWMTKGKSQVQVADKLRGRIASQVELMVYRNGKELRFNIFRTLIIVNTSSANLCESLDTLLKSGRNLNALIVSKKMGYGRATNILLPGFDSGFVDRGDDQKYVFEARYFLGRDSEQVMLEYQRLVSDITDCLPYSVISANSVSINKIGGRISKSIRIDGAKSQSFNWIKGAELEIFFKKKDRNFFETGIKYIPHF